MGSPENLVIYETLLDVFELLKKIGYFKLSKNC